MEWQPMRCVQRRPVLGARQGSCNAASGALVKAAPCLTHSPDPSALTVCASKKHIAIHSSAVPAVRHSDPEKLCGRSPVQLPTHWHRSVHGATTVSVVFGQHLYGILALPAQAASPGRAGCRTVPHLHRTGPVHQLSASPQAPEHSLA